MSQSTFGKNINPISEWVNQWVSERVDGLPSHMRLLQPRLTCRDCSNDNFHVFYTCLCRFLKKTSSPLCELVDKCHRALLENITHIKPVAWGSVKGIGPVCDAESKWLGCHMEGRWLVCNFEIAFLRNERVVQLLPMPHLLGSVS